ncbi:MAG: tRNA (adenosine(37)-N6)-threonylcarbamoyltransferase complex dimerization subunit type 1 TsaB [Gemmatimonadota bacterium]|nr:tRNA (adenosine(37)-N6)-threonylcarbamoyltransferase complex dimerization subunit type 1 TsaB [Gemmatimonadota bacterium]
MLILALDTSTLQGSVALGQGDAVLGESTLSISATHSETVLPAIDRLLKQAGRSASDLEAVVVGSGPGSFTGVRIAAALARGLCFPGGTPLFAYSSLAAIAMDSDPDPDEAVCALLDARRDQVYAAGYRIGSGLEELFAPVAGSLDEILSGLDPKAWTFTGVLPEPLRETIRRSGARLLPPDRGRPRASALLRLVRSAPEAGRVKDPARWEPGYVRASSAERRVGDA